MSTLGPRDLAILEFEKVPWRYQGHKEQAIRDLFDMTATSYHQVLAALIDDPAALAAEPQLVRRLQRVRAQRRRLRSAS